MTLATRRCPTRYFDNRDYFLDRLNENFLAHGELDKSKAKQFDDFFTFLQTRVVIVLIQTTDFETAFSIFGVLNNRGLPLSNVDLFRNFVISEFARKKIEQGAEKWYALESEFVLTEDFLGRWIESLRGTKYRRKRSRSN
ncbi:MAG: GmrSD restriction endonuclease domain-containing protein, partial [Polyangiales bacterium]